MWHNKTSLGIGFSMNMKSLEIFRGTDTKKESTPKRNRKSKLNTFSVSPTESL